MTQTTQRAVRAAALSLAMLAAMAAIAPAQFADFPPLPNTPDPGVMPFNNGFVVVGTSTAKADRAFPIMFSKDLREWKRIGYVFGGKDSGPIPDWIDLQKSRSLWAPEIEPVGNTVVVHHSAFSKKTGARCIGRSSTTAPTTFTPDIATNLRFTDLGGPLLCGDPAGSYSLIDPSLFQAPNGQPYLLYKRDFKDAAKKEIAITELNADRTPDQTKTHSILKATEDWELKGVAGGKGSVEGPTMIFKDGMYYLFYSGNDYRTDKYGVGVARSDSPTGKFVKNPGNPILTGDRTPRFCGVGHQDVLHDSARGWLIFYHSYRGSRKERCKTDIGRFMKVERLRWSKRTGWPFVNRSKPTGRTDG